MSALLLILVYVCDAKSHKNYHEVHIREVNYHPLRNLKLYYFLIADQAVLTIVRSLNPFFNIN